MWGGVLPWLGYLGAPLALAGQSRAQYRPSAALDGGCGTPGSQAQPDPSSQPGTHHHDRTGSGGGGICLRSPLALCVSGGGWRTGMPLPPEPSAELQLRAQLPGAAEQQGGHSFLQEQLWSEPGGGGGASGGRLSSPLCSGPSSQGPPTPIPSLFTQRPHSLIEVGPEHPLLAQPGRVWDCWG